MPRKLMPLEADVSDLISEIDAPDPPNAEMRWTDKDGNRQFAHFMCKFPRNPDGTYNLRINLTLQTTSAAKNAGEALEKAIEAFKDGFHLDERSIDYIQALGSAI